MAFGALAAAEVQTTSPALVILDVDPDGLILDENRHVEVLFDAPLPFGDEGVVGHYFSDLIVSEPMFAPIEGLPDIAWKGKTCAGCHHWEREALCTQGGTYLKPAGAEAILKKHPLGGTFKQNLRNWAEGGCK